MSVNINGSTSRISAGNNWFKDTKTLSSWEQETGGQTLKSDSAVMLSISREGLESCRESLQEGNGKAAYGKDMEKKHAFVEQAKNAVFVNQAGSELSRKVSELKGLRESNGIYSLSDKAEDYVSAYANLYDEIVQGYKNGTRERYVEDAGSETGFRKLTVEEELGNLDEAYRKAAEVEGKLAENARNAASAFKDTAEKLSKYQGVKTSFANAYQNLEKQGVVPQRNMGQKMTALAQAWKEAYQASGSLENGMERISSMLNDMFHTGSMI